MRALAFVLAIAGCAASTSTRAVVSAKIDYVEAEPAAQPVASSPDPASTASSTPAPSGSLPAGDSPFVVGLLDGEHALEDAWDRWNAGKTETYDAVFEIAVLANRARPLPMSDELMVIALARAAELSGCDPDRLGRIRLLAIAVHTSPHIPEIDGELARLADMGPQECARLAPR